MAAPTPILQTGKVKNSVLASHEAGMELNGSANAITDEVSTPGASTGKSELISSESGEKEHSEHTVADGDKADRIPLKPKLITGATSSSTADGIVTDGNESKEGESEKAPGDETMTDKGVPAYRRQNEELSMLPLNPTVTRTGEMAVPTPILQTGKVKNSVLASHEAGMELNGSANAITDEVSTPGATTGKSELISSESGEKEHSEHTVADGDKADRIPLKPKLITGATSSSAADDIVTDGNESKEGESEKAPGDETMTGKGVPAYGRQNEEFSMLPLHPTVTRTGEMAAPTPILQTGKVKNSVLASHEAGMELNGSANAITDEVSTPGATTGKSKLISSESGEKEHSEHTVAHGDKADRIPLKLKLITGATSSSAADGIVTDGNESKEGESEKAPGDETMTGKGVPAYGRQNEEFSMLPLHPTVTRTGEMAVPTPILQTGKVKNSVLASHEAGMELNGSANAITDEVSTPGATTGKSKLISSESGEKEHSEHTVAHGDKADRIPLKPKLITGATSSSAADGIVTDGNESKEGESEKAPGDETMTGKGVPAYGRQNEELSMLPLHPTVTRTGEMAAPTPILQTGKVKNSVLASHEAGMELNGSANASTDEVSTPGATTGKSKLISSESGEKEHSEHTVAHGDKADRIPLKLKLITGATSSSAADSIVTDGNESKEGESEKAPGDETMTDKGVPVYGKQNEELSMHPTVAQTGEMAVPTPILQTGKVTNTVLASHEAEMELNGTANAITDEVSTPGATTGKSELISSESGEKEHSEHTVADGDKAESIPPKPQLSTGATSSSAADDIVTGGNECKEGESEKELGDETMTGKGVAETVPHGTLFEETKSAGYGTSASEPTKGPTEDEYTSTTSPAGAVSPDEGSDPGDHSLFDSCFDNVGDTDPSEKKAKATNPCSWQGADASNDSNLNQCPPGIASSTKKESTDLSVCAYNGFGYAATPVGPAAPETIMPTAAQMEMLQQFLANLQQLQPNLCSSEGPKTAGIRSNEASSGHPSLHSSGDATRVVPPMQPKSYDKGGYSVIVTNGTLCQSSDEKGVVMMENGTQFEIAIANNNDYAAEVDITFGRVFLGVWLVEAKRSLSNPLIIEGSSWAKGRMTFISDTSPYIEFSGQETEFSGVIELKFKPEAPTLKLVVKHVWKDSEITKEISMPDFQTATVGDLKREINLQYRPEVSCLIISGRVLEEDKTMSSYALENTNEVVEVLHIEEELSIVSQGKESVSMTVDPSKISIGKVKSFIEEKMNIRVNDQRLRLMLRGQNIDENDRLCDIFITAKQVPVIKVVKNDDINKSYEGESRTSGFGSETTRAGSGDFDVSSTANCGDISSGFGTLHGDPVDLQSGSAGSGGLGQGGIALLYGNEESVCKKFQQDNQDKKFSNQKAVTLKIQLIAKSCEATAPPSSSTPSGEHNPSEATGPMSTPHPPPVPE